jgi:hypothetical protein
MEQGEGSQQGKPLAAFSRVVSAALVAIELDPLVEKSGDALRPFLDLPFVFLGLLVGCPSWIARHEGERRHAECHNVDAAIADACGSVLGHAWAACLRVVPRLPPGWCAGLEGGNDLVSDFGVVISGTAIMPAHWDALLMG